MRRLKIILIIAFLFNQITAYAVYPAPITGKQGMVVSVQPIASQVGIDIRSSA